MSIVAKRLDGSRWHLAWRSASVRPHCARRGPSFPPQKGATAPKFSAYFYCGQTAGWTKTSLGTEIDLGPGHIVLDGDPSPPAKRAQPPLFGPCLLWPRLPMSATAELLLQLAQLTAERPYTLQWTELPLKIAPSKGNLDPV